MEISRTATGLLVVACIAGGAGATYLTMGQRAVSMPDPSVELVASSPEPVPVTPSPAPSVVAAKAAPPVAAAPRPAQRPAPTPMAAATPAPPAATERAVPEAAAPVPAPSPVAAVEPEPVVDDLIDEVMYEELVVSANSVIGLQLDDTISTEHAEVEDSVVARVTRDVRVADRVAIPAGARAHGEVVLVESGGRLRDRARLAVRFTSISLADGTTLAIRTEPIYREGDAPGRESATKIGGGAIGGAIIGGILGGAKGAAIGGSIGAGAGTAAVAAGGRNHAVLPAGSPLTVRLEEPLIVTVEP